MELSSIGCGRAGPLKIQARYREPWLWSGPEPCSRRMGRAARRRSGRNLRVSIVSRQIRLQKQNGSLQTTTNLQAPGNTPQGRRRSATNVHRLRAVQIALGARAQSTQFANFNFTNALICTIASSARRSISAAVPITERHAPLVGRHRLISPRGGAYGPIN